jgi:site-specific DNA-methyltransferase (adenine-specific)
MNYTIEHSDAVDWLKSLDAESVDLVITDPAYESLEKHRAIGTTTRLTTSDASSNKWFPIFGNERFPALFEQLYRVLKNGTHCYVLCDQETMFVVHDVAQKAGFTWHKFLVWDKVRPGMGYHYRATHEVICFLEKGKRKGDNPSKLGCLNDLSVPDVLRVERVSKGYPTEKPVDLLKILVKQSSNPGDLVIDPFTGSASTGVASMLCGRRFAGCDVKQSAVEAGRRRLAETPFLTLK